MVEDHSADEASTSINRRRVVKAAGATAAGIAVGSGTASAHEVTEDGGPVFCGCSQVCACVNWKADVIVATENDDGSFSCEAVPVEDNFCYEVNEGKIIALDVHGNGDVYCNPNTNCAGDALEDCEISCDESGEQGGPCGQPPCEHPGRANGRDNRGRRNQGR